MKINIDGQFYHLNIGEIAAHLQSLYTEHKGSLEQPVEKNGIKFDFGRKSVLRIAVKSAIVPLVLPIIRTMYENKGLQLRPHIKHEDLIDYIVENVLTYVATIEKEFQLYVLTIPIGESGYRYVKALSTNGQAALERTVSGDEQEVTEESSTKTDIGGQAHVRRGEDGHGQDSPNKSNNSQEGVTPSLPERVPPGHQASW